MTTRISHSSKMNLKPLYIILVPVILLFSLLNTGLFHRSLPAVTIDSTAFTALEFNCYYYRVKNEFIETNFDRLDSLGFDPAVSAKNQAYNSHMTWWDYFYETALTDMKQDLYYHRLALDAQWTLPDSYSLMITEALNDIESSRQAITLENYLSACYGTGMTYEKYRSMLIYTSLAQSYKSYLTSLEKEVVAKSAEALSVTDISEDYPTANLRLIAIHGQNDLLTGKAETAQLNALNAKMNELSDRYTSGNETFSELLAAFCDDADLTASNGILISASKEDVPDVLHQWLFQNDRCSGDTAVLIDNDSAVGYFAIYDSVGESAFRLKAIESASEEHIKKQEENVTGTYAITRTLFGTKLIDR